MGHELIFSNYTYACVAYMKGIYPFVKYMTQWNTAMLKQLYTCVVCTLPHKNYMHGSRIVLSYYCLVSLLFMDFHALLHIDELVEERRNSSASSME